MAIDQQLDGRVLRITLNRPEKRNALDVEMCREVVGAVREAGTNPRVGAILLAGAGKAFCAGMDLREAPHVDRAALAEAHDRLFTIADWAAKPLIAAVHGPAIAGGTGLAANAHVLIAAEDATFGLTEVRLGLWPVLIFPAIVAAVGERRAVELALTGRLFGAAEAERYGLATEVVPAHELAARSFAIATAIANASSIAIGIGLRYVREIRGTSSPDALKIGRLRRDEIMEHPDFAEGLAAFQEKRAPSWPSNVI